MPDFLGSIIIILYLVVWPVFNQPVLCAYTACGIRRGVYRTVLSCEIYNGENAQEVEIK